MPNPIEYGYLELEYLSSPYLTTIAGWATGFQVDRVNEEEEYVGFQAARTLLDEDYNAFEVRRDFSIAHHLCPDSGYLEEEYLMGSYLTRCYIAQMGFQADRKFIKVMGFQANLVLYNTIYLRVLCDFASRGNTGLNWTADSTETGDFNANNLNTDIVEQVWRSQTGTVAATLTCDTEVPQGVAVDTLAILNHNITSSATITIEASNSPTFSPVGETIPIEWEEENIYYIAPQFPINQWRYWRILISDATNPDNYLQVGTIVFGMASILAGECFTDEVTRTQKHFADKIATEGFTNVSNDRALKRQVDLEFLNIAYNRGNYKKLAEVFKTARTSLKCLWIPDPQDASRFAVFGKLVDIPPERHKKMGPNEADTVDFNISLDESL